MLSNMDNLQGNKILIVGLGQSGTAAANTLADMGTHVYVQDSRKESEFDTNFISYIRGKGIGCFFGKEPYDMGFFDMIILSPGVNPKLDFIERGRRQGAEVTGELEIAYRIGRGNFVAITGTNGKTTTTALVGQIFKNSGRTTHVVGNIGAAVITSSTKADEDDWLVTECSSFQLETTKYFKPKISAILNLTPDHLDRHIDMESYSDAKSKIFQNQTEDGFLIVNYDDSRCKEMARDANCTIVPFSRRQKLDFGAFLKDEKIVVRDNEKTVVICNTHDLKIRGAHNVENVLAASAIAYFAGIDCEVIKETVLDFYGVEHRIEYCGMIDDVEYYNDSKGTNVEASVTALKAFDGDAILIAGGEGKGQNFDAFAESIAQNVKHLLLMGQDAQIIGKACEKYKFDKTTYCKDMPDCVRQANELAEAGDVVLLSPACASWDMYENYEQRGNHFKECVRMLAK